MDATRLYCNHCRRNPPISTGVFTRVISCFLCGRVLYEAEALIIPPPTPPRYEEVPYAPKHRSKKRYIKSQNGIDAEKRERSNHLGRQ